MDGVLNGFRYASVDEGVIDAVVRCFAWLKDAHSRDAQGAHGVVTRDGFDTDVGNGEAKRL